jgi:hypothetical protein
MAEPLKLEGIGPCTADDLMKLALLRAVPLKGLQLACDRRLLFSNEYPHEGDCWIITDDARRNAIARRLDGKPFGGLEPQTVEVRRRKSTCIWGSEANWPIGIAQANGFPAISLHEGGPDLLSAFLLIWAGAVEELVAPVCMTGASCRIHEDALPLFRGKRVRIFGHADEAGQEAVKRWAEQLRLVQADVDAFDFDGLVRVDGSPVKDLNDFLLADHKALRFPHRDCVWRFRFRFGKEGLIEWRGRGRYQLSPQVMVRMEILTDLHAS